MAIEDTFLPVDQMLQVSRVTEISGPVIRGEVDLGAGHWVYPQHFPGDPIFPGTLMIEAAGQLVALWAWANGERGRPRLVRRRGGVPRPRLPQRSSGWRCAERSSGSATCASARSRVEAAGGEVAVISAVLVVLPPEPSPEVAGDCPV